MDVEDPAAEGGHEIRREQAHVAGEADPLGARLPQGGDHLLLVGPPARLPFVGDRHRREAQLARPRQPRRLRDVARHQDDPRRHLAALDGGVQGQEVAAAPGEEDGDGGHWEASAGDGLSRS